MAEMHRRGTTAFKPRLLHLPIHRKALNMVRTDRRLQEEKLDARLILQVHDELIVESDESCFERVRAILKEEMEGAVSLAVPLTVSTAIGKNWLEAEH